MSPLPGTVQKRPLHIDTGHMGKPRLVLPLPHLPENLPQILLVNGHGSRTIGSNQEDKTFVKKDLYLEKGRIVENRDQVSDTTEVDAEGLYVLPGLVDVHSHGAVGCDFSDGSIEGLKKILS